MRKSAEKSGDMNRVTDHDLRAGLRCIYRQKASKRGYITLEASIILPIFIIAILALGYYIKVFAIMEEVTYSIMDETSLLASEAYVKSNAPLFEKNLKNRIVNDSPDAENLKINKVRYLYYDGDLDDLISVSVEYDIDAGFPLGIGHTIKLNPRVKCRGFTGVEKSADAMSFEEMESEGVWDPVWIFPMSGEKYHKEDCTYVTANAREMVLTGNVKKKYSPCSLCNAENLSMGEFVYCFTENGAVYHRESCRLITRYTIEINRSEAISKGYIPCSKCGGG